jgi:hypothetical protein
MNRNDLIEAGWQEIAPDKWTSPYMQLPGLEVQFHTYLQALYTEQVVRHVRAQKADQYQRQHGRARPFFVADGGAATRDTQAQPEQVDTHALRVGTTEMRVSIGRRYRTAIRIVLFLIAVVFIGILLALLTGCTVEGQGFGLAPTPTSVQSVECLTVLVVGEVHNGERSLQLQHPVTEAIEVVYSRGVIGYQTGTRYAFRFDRPYSANSDLPNRYVAGLADAAICR